MNSTSVKILAFVLYIGMAFTVLFDPTEMALGAQFVTLSGGALTLATIIGNFAWVLGVLYMIVSCLFIWMLLDDGILKKSVLDAIKDKSIKKYKPRFYKSVIWLSSLIISVIAIGSGFWFTGFFWFTGVLLGKALTTKIRKTDEYKAFLTEV